MTASNIVELRANQVLVDRDKFEGLVSLISGCSTLDGMVSKLGGSKSTYSAIRNQRPISRRALESALNRANVILGTLEDSADYLVSSAPDSNPKPQMSAGAFVEEFTLEVLPITQAAKQAINADVLELSADMIDATLNGYIASLVEVVQEAFRRSLEATNEADNTDLVLLELSLVSRLEEAQSKGVYLQTAEGSSRFHELVEFRPGVKSGHQAEAMTPEAFCRADTGGNQKGAIKGAWLGATTGKEYYVNDPHAELNIQDRLAYLENKSVLHLQVTQKLAPTNKKIPPVNLLTYSAECGLRLTEGRPLSGLRRLV